MDLNFENVSRAVPELGKAEVDLLLSHLNEDRRLSSSTDHSIQMFARRLFPELYEWRAFKNREAVFTAIELLKDADAVLADINEMSDEVARTQQDIKSNIVYLFKEIGEE
jgi:uncharacterized protein HemX